MNPQPTIVCGSNYGGAYVRALRDLEDACRLAGILARGSHRSRRLAGAAAVPLFTDVDMVPREVSLACVAIPSSEHALLETLMERGIDVLTEHPIGPTTLHRCLDRARKSGRVFHVNAHFSGLESPRAFIDACRTLAAEAAPGFLEFLTTDRMLYGTVDTVLRAVGPVGPAVVRRPAPSSPPVRVLTGSLGDLPFSALVQGWGPADGAALPDGSRHYFADLRLSAHFPQGTLTLLSLAGPVLWTWNLSRSMGRGEALRPTTVREGVSSTALAADRDEANRSAFLDLVSEAEGGDRPPAQDPGHLLSVARAYEALASAWRS